MCFLVALALGRAWRIFRYVTTGPRLEFIESARVNNLTYSYAFVTGSINVVNVSWMQERGGSNFAATAKVL